MPDLLLMTAETVWMETPAARATSFIVIFERRGITRRKKNSIIILHVTIHPNKICWLKNLVKRRW
jgi:hypothetical protein